VFLVVQTREQEGWLLLSPLQLLLRHGATLLALLLLLLKVALRLFHSQHQVLSGPQCAGQQLRQLF
jgi:hypothetical protein